MPPQAQLTTTGWVAQDDQVIISRTFAALPLLAFALTGCGGSAAPVGASVGQPIELTNAPTGSPSAGPQPASRFTAAAAPTHSASASAGAPVTAARSGSTVSASQAGSSGTPAKTTAFTSAGTYTYDTSGTVTVLGGSKDASGMSTLTVDAPAAGSQHSVLSDGQGKTTQDVLSRSGGSYLSRLQITNAAFDKTFAPSPEALLLPEPAKPGATWTWTATSTDGKTTVTAKNTVLRTETLTIGGQPVATTVIRTVLALRGADLTYDGTQDTWFAPAEHLAVKQHNTGNGNSSGLAFSSDTTSTAQSTHPS